MSEPTSLEGHIAYQSSQCTLYLGDCLDVLAMLPDNSIDAIVTDPPYGLEFMGKDWDAPWKTRDGFRSNRTSADAGRGDPFGRASRTSPQCTASHGFQHWCEQWARECLRVLKPGGHILAFGGTRTYHRLAVAVEDAGFEIRDSITWLYAQGFPKSLNVSKAIDKAAGAQRQVVGHRKAGASSLERVRRVELGYRKSLTNVTPEAIPVTMPATANAAQWEGWGTALKPASEPIVVARKPFAGTVAANVLEHGTGGLNIDACRIEMSAEDAASITAAHAGMDTDSYQRPAGSSLNLSVNPMPLKAASAHPAGRWPTNVILTHPPLLDTTGQPVGDACADGCVPGCPVAELDWQSGVSQSRIGRPRGAASGDGWGMTATSAEYADAGGASRFFPVFRYQAKALAKERPKINGVVHPTVKPLPLIQWLIRLITPPGGTVLDPFTGSGTTLEAAALEGFSSVGIEAEAPYIPLCLVRLERVAQTPQEEGV